MSKFASLRHLVQLALCTLASTGLPLAAEELPGDTEPTAQIVRPVEPNAPLHASTRAVAPLAPERGGHPPSFAHRGGAARGERGPAFDADASGCLWLEGLVLLLINGVGLRLYRVRQLARQCELRRSERLAERLRIARELHDSLLQVLQAELFRLQAARNLLPARAEEAIPLLDEALRRGGSSIAQVRDAVHNLRSQALAGQDLVQALKAVGNELPPGMRHGELRVQVGGRPLALDPIARDEIYCIAREALRNALRHARAHVITVDIDYGAACFVMRVHDDGIGIAREAMNAAGCEDHWGLPGMDERAAAFGARLWVKSGTGAGTVVELVVPGHAAYRRVPACSAAQAFTPRIEVCHE